MPPRSPRSSRKEPSMSESTPAAERSEGPQRLEAVESVPDTSVDIRVEEIAELPPGKMLEVDDVTLRFGGVKALDGVSFHINTGEILGLIGPNGAGKTTCFNVMTGVYQPTSGARAVHGRAAGQAQQVRDHQAGHRAHVPEHPALPQHDGAGERPRRRGRAPLDRDLLGPPEAAQAPGRGGRGHGPGPGAAQVHGSGRGGPTSWPATSPTATSAVWRSPGPSRRTPSCSASTSRLRGSTRPRRPGSWS